METVALDHLADADRTLIDEALAAWRNGFNPYSGFLAGAALRTTSGEIVRGSNMFISSTGLSQCAEVTALTTANTDGIRDVAAMAVVAGRQEEPEGEVYASCGRCRQVLHEFAQLGNADIPLFFSNPARSSVLVTSIHALLPTAYTSGALRSFRTNHG